ncbi:MAG TPA: hypothetical protein VMM92_09080 [Thermoanaerobaculia bacterium]|nr:hypothetical protein [Thermoanaerobaculia bacterium]
MDDSWEVKVKGFLNRTGAEIKKETQKLVDEMSNPANHEKVRQSLREMGDWAKKTAEDAAAMVEQAARKVEGAIGRARARKAGAKTAGHRAGAKKGRSGGGKTIGRKRPR